MNCTEEFIAKMKQKDIVINFVQAWRNDTLEESYARLDKPTRLHAYSVSKSVTSIGVGLAVQEGLLRLDDPEERLSALRHIIRAGLNVAQAEQYVGRRLEALQATPPAGRRTFILKDVRLFLNSLDRGLRLVREAGIGAESRREDTEDAILLTIRIPKAVRRG